MLRRLALLVILLAFFGCVSQNPPAPNQSYAQNVSNETINQTYNGTTENISIVNSTSIENDSSQNASIVNVSVANGSAGNSSISSSSNASLIPSVCGNGIREGSEQCDGTDDSACKPFQYCRGCKCIDKPQVCGDGKIEGTEQCENDSDCRSPLVCVKCMCVWNQSVCGDGILEAGEQCDAGHSCASGYHCSGCKCLANPGYCGDGKIDPGEQCDPNANPTGCKSGVCSATCQCVSPPTLDCGQICGNTPGAQNIGGNYTSQDECAAAVQSIYNESCSLSCSYAQLYKVSNPAGSATCCCAVAGPVYPCSNCSCLGMGCNQSCPSEQTCQQDAPTWYQITNT